MKSVAQLPEQWRPAVKNSISRSPLVRSAVAFTAGTALFALPRFFEAPPRGLVLLAFSGLALGACIAGTLVLLQSAAIRRIRHLRNSSKKQLDELSRCTLYSEQVHHSLVEIVNCRSESRGPEPLELVQRILDSAVTPMAVAFDPSVRFYVVETTVTHHLVVARSGSEAFAIEPGKSCRTDRTLQEVAAGLGACSLIVPLSLRGGRCNLVMLSDSHPTRADHGFVMQLGLLLSLTGEPSRRRSQHRQRSAAKLRAV